MHCAKDRTEGSSRHSTRSLPWNCCAMALYESLVKWCKYVWTVLMWVHMNSSKEQVNNAPIAFVRVYSSACTQRCIYFVSSSYCCCLFCFCWECRKQLSDRQQQHTVANLFILRYRRQRIDLRDHHIRRHPMFVDLPSTEKRRKRKGLDVGSFYAGLTLPTESNWSRRSELGDSQWNGEFRFSYNVFN